MAPVWVVGFSSGLTLRMGPPQDLGHTRYGWEIKMAWLVGPHATQHVTLRGWALRGGVPLWFQLGGNRPTTAPILDPQHPVAWAPNLPAGWAFFPSYLLIPQAGCYAVQARWPGGMWQVAFAAGRTAVLEG